MLLPQSGPGREKCQRSQSRHNYNSLSASLLNLPVLNCKTLILTIISIRTETLASRCFVVAEATREIRLDLSWQLIRVLIQSRVGILVARSVVPAGRIQTVRDVLGAVLPVISRPAVAVVVVDQVDAGGVVAAGRHLALVDVHLAGLAGEAGVLAVAGEHVDAVRALPSVQTRGRLAVVNVELAVAALVAGGAGAAVVVDLVQAGGAIEAGRALALVDVRLTPGTCRDINTSTLSRTW